MDLPVIPTPIAPRWVWMEEITYSHIPIATVITAFMVLAPIYEYVGWRRKDPRFDRLALSLIWFSLILFSPGAALGTGIPMFLMGTYPEFWSRWSNIFFWPLITQMFFFLAEVGFLFFGYYLSWNVLAHRKRLHIFLGCCAAFFGLLVQVVWDALGSYMMTPGRARLPGVDEPVAWSAAAFFNPSFLTLFVHRFVGNISYVMLLTGGVLALMYMRSKSKENKDYYGFASNLTFAIGFLFFFPMPFIGWWYARVLQDHAPVAFTSVMGGHTSTHFIVKMSLLFAMLVVAGSYFFTRYRGKALLAGVTAAVAALYVILHWHPALDWFGSAAAWRVFYTVVLAAVLAWLWLFRGRMDSEHKYWRWGLFGVGMAAFLAFCLGGFVRERSRQPYSVYGELEKPEITSSERNRWLFYDKCIRCHHESVDDFEAFAGQDWTERMRIERARPGVTLTDEEAARIVKHLEEAYP